MPREHTITLSFRGPPSIERFALDRVADAAAAGVSVNKSDVYLDLLTLGLAADAARWRPENGQAFATLDRPRARAARRSR